MVGKRWEKCCRLARILRARAPRSFSTAAKRAATFLQLTAAMSKLTYTRALFEYLISIMNNTRAAQIDKDFSIFIEQFVFVVH